MVVGVLVGWSWGGVGWGVRVIAESRRRKQHLIERTSLVAQKRRKRTVSCYSVSYLVIFFSYQVQFALH